MTRATESTTKHRMPRRALSAATLAVTAVTLISGCATQRRAPQAKPATPFAPAVIPPTARPGWAEDAMSSFAPAQTGAWLYSPADAGSGDAGRPVLGRWTAAGTVVGSDGYGNEHLGDRLQRSWIITRRCHGVCRLWLSRTVGSGSVTQAPLQLTPHGWRVVWPRSRFPCGAAGHVTTYWVEQNVWRLRFTHSGTVAAATERSVSYGAKCGWGFAVLAWHARRQGVSILPPSHGLSGMTA